MRRRLFVLLPALVAAAVLPAFLAGCGDDAQGQGALAVTASTSFLADIAQQVAGDRFTVQTLIEDGTDPHSFEPAPRDVARVVEGDLFLVNGNGLEGGLLDSVRDAGGEVNVVEASAGLQPRRTGSGADGGDGASGDVDPHFWLDPVLARHYVTAIRDAFAAADPSGSATYRQNAEAYDARLRELHRWALHEVAAVPPTRRVLVTDHETYGYFADRYGFQVVGAIIPSASGGESPSARQLTELVTAIRGHDVKAIFLERTGDTRLAEQIAGETGVRVVPTLLDHSLTGPDGPAPTYIDMIRYNVRQIVEALR